MNIKKRLLVLGLVLAVLLASMAVLAGCSSDSEKNQSSTSESKTEQTKTEKEKEKKKAKTEKEKEKEEKAKEEKNGTNGADSSGGSSNSASNGSGSSSGSSSKSSSGGSGSKDSAGDNSNSTGGTTGSKPSGHVLTVKSGSKKIYYTEGQLKKLGTVSYRYSFRNSDSPHRQFQTFSGVKFTTLISKAGVSGSSARVIAEDGYTKVYSVSDLKTSKKAFKKTTGTSGNSVPTLITMGEEGSFRLCFGQRADDSDDNGDYNMQNWAKWIDSIEIY